MVWTTLLGTWEANHIPQHYNNNFTKLMAFSLYYHWVTRLELRSSYFLFVLDFALKTSFIQKSIFSLVINSYLSYKVWLNFNNWLNFGLTLA